MANGTLFERLVKDASNLPVGERLHKVPLHVFFPGILRVLDGRNTQAQLRAFVGVDGAEHDAQWNYLVSGYQAAKTAGKVMQFHQRMLALFYLAEGDKTNASGLRTLATFQVEFNWYADPANLATLD